MRQSQHTELEIHDYLGRAHAGLPIADICAMARITPRTFYRWRTRYGGVTRQSQSAVKDLQLENSRLRALVASLTARVTAGAARTCAPHPLLRHDQGDNGASLGRFAFVRGPR